MKTKTIISGVIAAAMFAMTGCDKDPTVEEMTTLGTVSGYTAAYVMNNQVKVDDATRNGIIAVMTEVEKYVPETNATYAATWTPIAEKFLNELKDKDGNTLPEEVKARVLKDFGYIVGLLDKYIEKKSITGKKDLVDAFIHSFFSSFLTSFKPANVMSAGAEAPELDKTTVKILEDLIK